METISDITYLEDLPVGAVVVGDLERLGFVVFKSHPIDNGTRGSVADLKRLRGHKASGITSQPHRKLLYPQNASEVNNDISLPHHAVNQHMNNVLTTVLHRNLIPPTCRIVKPNLIYNTGIIEKDQIPHYDYGESDVIQSYNENYLSRHSS